MKLKDIADMEAYLKGRCYCPGEIYDLSGFFFQVFSGDVECEILAEGERGAVHGVFAIARDERKHPEQIIYIEITDNRVDSCTRLDNTENNRDQIRRFLAGEIEKMAIDEYSPGKTEALNEILGIADAIIYD